MILECALMLIVLLLIVGVVIFFIGVFPLVLYLVERRILWGDRKPDDTEIELGERLSPLPGRDDETLHENYIRSIERKAFKNLAQRADGKGDQS